MNLQGSIAKLQSSGARLYVVLAQCFNENNLIRDMWLEMARDKEQQVGGLRSLPRSFWSEMRKRADGLLAAARSCIPLAECSKDEEHSLQKCLAKTLDFEEPIILKVYAPLIRQLRTEWTGHALDFYVIVKAHVARILRVVQSFSGDPVLIQRAATVLRDFEREVQAPEVPAFPVILKASNKTVSKKIRQRAHKVAAHRTHVKTAARSLPLGKRTKGLAAHPKPLVKSIQLRRRRARR